MKEIEFKDVSFSYPDGFVANEHLNLKIRHGERVAIVGQNGAGKTTAVKLMNGLNKPSEGDVFVNGINTKTKTAAQISRYVGYVFQNPDDQIFNQDVVSEITYMPRYMKLPDEEIKKRLEYAIKMTHLDEYRKSNPLDIPYSIRKFVSIAAILAVEPEHIILDEPTAGQDVKGIRILTELLDELRDRGITVITITHDMEFVANNFERVIVMANKKIIEDGNVRDIFWDDQVLKESHIKRPQIGELAYNLKLKENILFRDELLQLLIKN